MNKKIISILFLTIIAIVVLVAYSYGPLANNRKKAQLNPASLKPSAITQTTELNNKAVVLNNYHNKDLKENYYTVQFPGDWQVSAGQTPGSYALNFPQGNGEVQLQDVADNTTLELFVLSQDEPSLKKKEVNYKRIDYQKLSLNNADVYRLIYESTLNNETYRTIKTYVTGTDHAGVVTLLAKQNDFPNLQPLFDKVINSFQWENK